MSGFRRLNGLSASLYQAIGRVRTTNEQFIGLNEVLVLQEKAERIRSSCQELQKSISATRDEISAVEKEWELFQNHRISYYQSNQTQRNPLRLKELNHLEIELNVKKQELEETLAKHERAERDAFQELSETMWDAHRKEIAQHERVKAYGNIATAARALAGLLGALLGYIGSSWVTRRKISGLQSQLDTLTAVVDGGMSVAVSTNERVIAMAGLLADHVNASAAGTETGEVDLDLPVDNDLSSSSTGGSLQTDHTVTAAVLVAKSLLITCMLLIG